MEFHYRVFKGLILYPIMVQMNPPHILVHVFFKILCNINHSRTPRSHILPLPLKLISRNLLFLISVATQKFCGYNCFFFFFFQIWNTEKLQLQRIIISLGSYIFAYRKGIKNIQQIKCWVRVSLTFPTCQSYICDTVQINDSHPPV